MGAWPTSTSIGSWSTGWMTVWVGASGDGESGGMEGRREVEMERGEGGLIGGSMETLSRGKTHGRVKGERALEEATSLV